MAQAILNASNVHTSLAQNKFIITGVATFANTSNISYTSVVGIPFNLKGLVPTVIDSVARNVIVQSANASGISAYEYRFRPASTSNANLSATGVQVFVNGNLATEVATGNLPSAVVNDVIEFIGFVNR
jgi:hypothetical protein